MQPLNLAQVLETDKSFPGVLMYGFVRGYLERSPSYIDDSKAFRKHVWAVVEAFAVRNKSGQVFTVRGTFLTPLYPGRLPKPDVLVKIGKFYSKGSPLFPGNLNFRSGNTTFIPWSPSKDEYGAILGWRFGNMGWTTKVEPDVMYGGICPDPSTNGLTPFSLSTEGIEVVSSASVPFTHTSSTDWTESLRSSPEDLKASTVSGIDLEPRWSLEDSISYARDLFEQNAHQIQGIPSYLWGNSSVNLPDMAPALLKAAEVLEMGSSRREFAEYVYQCVSGSPVPGWVFDNPSKYLETAATPPQYASVTLGYLISVSPRVLRDVLEDHGTASYQLMLEHPLFFGLSYDFGYNSSLDLATLSVGCGVPLEHYDEFLYMMSYYHSCKEGTLVSPKDLMSFPKHVPSDRLRRAPSLTVGILPPTPTRAEVSSSPLFKTFGDRCIPVVALQREVEFFLGMVERSKIPCVDSSLISASISNFEGQSGLKLEPEQREAVSLVSHSVGLLTGAAGSGKTTVAKCLRLALEMGGYSVELAAPTGKAALRMSEAIGVPAKTLHSLFNISPGDNLNNVNWPQSSPTDAKRRAFIIDESSMLDSDLAYHIYKNTQGCPVFFLGDANQLPPIGRGVPFLDMMSFLPSVRLGVSKRAAENSGISYNCSSLISDNIPLVERDDFRILPTTSVNIPSKVLAAVRSALQSGYAPSDIQVLTPYSSANRSWSSKALSPRIQEMVNPLPPVIRYYNTEFRLRDRVVHLMNSNDRPRYRIESSRTFTTVGYGVSNGEEGVIHSFVTARDVIIDGQTRWQQSRDRSYMVVEYSDGTFGLYTYDVRGFGGTADADEEPSRISMASAVSSDLRLVDLAYALTIHKSQGSQYPVVITILSESDSPRFVTRNMIYTAVSRAQKLAVIVGDHRTIQKLRRHSDDGSQVLTGLKKVMGRG